jgi:hypothetical protein
MSRSTAALACVSATPTSITIAFDAVPKSDLYYVGLIDERYRVVALTTVAGDSGLDCLRGHTGACSTRVPPQRNATFGGLSAATTYTFSLRSHPASAPSIVWGWRNATLERVSCSTLSIGSETRTAAEHSASKRGAGGRSQFTRMFRVSEFTYDVDFLPNHNSADLDGQVAFLSSGAPDGVPEFSQLPITEYCVEHLDRPFAEYISCNGPEASPRNTPSDPICICNVYADRMIGLQNVSTMDAACGPTVERADGTHAANPCNCSRNGPQGPGPFDKWTVSHASELFVGSERVYLPYFYYQEQLQSHEYAGIRSFGAWFSTPSKGRCGEDQALGTDGCTWKRSPRARVVYGDELLARGWNATHVNHWPLHKVAHNNTRQCLTNLPIMVAAFAQHRVRSSPECS